LSDGTAWACGDNSHGQLGDGTVNPHATPTQIPTLTGVIAVAAGSGFSLFLKSDSSVWSCGINTYGQLGVGDTNVRHSPSHVSGLSGIVQIAAGEYHSLFLKGNGLLS
jgi:alpha-tubulin suppressor-like RCC1 family protein